MIVGAAVAQPVLPETELRKGDIIAIDAEIILPTTARARRRRQRRGAVHQPAEWIPTVWPRPQSITSGRHRLRLRSPCRPVPTNFVYDVKSTFNNRTAIADFIVPSASASSSRASSR
jgi:hypothetical protein